MACMMTLVAASKAAGYKAVAFFSEEVIQKPGLKTIFFFSFQCLMNSLRLRAELPKQPVGITSLTDRRAKTETPRWPRKSCFLVFWWPSGKITVMWPCLSNSTARINPARLAGKYPIFSPSILTKTVASEYLKILYLISVLPRK